VNVLNGMCACLCSFVCVCMCVQEFQDFYKFKFGRKPKFVRRVNSARMYVCVCVLILLR